ncbi:unnamed protein product [Rangifer tarandus platyrhynchus]|uniref:Uncharacterized protein n=2 Tax=Rangifer tarandus platyrhynchus TaxID=3082113 RepID=A0ACB0F730_RANTA|nr:unnamed protein product [Rangifer tarandus platyrhynchus]CAI9708780.1 unnamed protein product [Rangifer tarandus platyrhynchus]
MSPRGGRGAGPESASPARLRGGGGAPAGGGPLAASRPARPRGALAPAARPAGRMGARGLAASPPARRGNTQPCGCEPKSDSWSSRLAVMLGSPAGHSLPPPSALTPSFGRTPAVPGAADPPSARPAAPAQVRGGGGCPGAPASPPGRITGQRFSFAGLQGRGRLSSKRSATYLLSLLAPGLSFLTSDWRTKRC